MDHGTFLGWIGDDVLHSLYRIADVCVVPSIYEPFGLVALEAMASGCPCIVADTGGLREVVPHDEAGPALPRPRPRGARRDGRARAHRRERCATASSPRAPSTCSASTGPTSPSAPPRSTRELAGVSAGGLSAAASGVGLDRVRPAQLARRVAHPQHPRRNAADDRVRGHVLGHDGVRADDRVVADPRRRAGRRRRSRPRRSSRRRRRACRSPGWRIGRSTSTTPWSKSMNIARSAITHCSPIRTWLVGGDRALLADHRLRRRSRPRPRGSGSWSRRRSRRSARSGPCRGSTICSSRPLAEEDRAVGLPAPAGRGEQAAPQVAPQQPRVAAG